MVVGKEGFQSASTEYSMEIEQPTALLEKNDSSFVKVQNIFVHIYQYLLHIAFMKEQIIDLGKQGKRLSDLFVSIEEGVESFC